MNFRLIFLHTFVRLCHNDFQLIGLFTNCRSNQQTEINKSILKKATHNNVVIDWVECEIWNNIKKNNKWLCMANFGWHRNQRIFGELEWKMGVSANTLHWQNCACALLRNRWRVCLCLCVCVFITLSKISSVDSAEGSRICSNVRFWATYATIIDTPNSIYMKYVYRNGIKNDPWLIIFYVNSMRDKLKTLVTLTKFNSIVIVQLRESKQEHSNEARCKTSCQQSTICIIQHFVIYSHFKTSHSHHSHHWARTHQLRL